MIQKKVKQNSFLEELYEIAFWNGEESNLPVIDDRRAFAKTEVFSKLRQGKLSDELICMMLEHFIFQGTELCHFVIKYLGELSVDKFLSIGGIDLLFSRATEDSRENQAFVILLLESIQLKNKSRDLSKILDYIQRKKQFRQNWYETKQIIRFIIDRLFIDGYKLLRSEEKGKIEAIEAINDNYMILYRLMNEQSLYETSPMKKEISYNIRVLSLTPPDLLHTTEEFAVDEVIEMQGFVCELHRMPFVNFSFCVRFINNSSGLSDRAKLVLLYNILTFQALDPTLDMNKALSYLEHRVQSGKEEICLTSILRMATSDRLERLEIFADRIMNSEFISYDRNKEIFKLYFEWIEPYTYSSRDLFKLKVMIGLNLPDKKIASYIESMLYESGTNRFLINTMFSCKPECSSTYFKKESLKVLLYFMLDNIEGASEYKEEDGEISNDIIEYFYSEHANRLGAEIPLTWKMANSPKFLKLITKSLYKDSFLLGIAMKRINLKSIGFKKYMQILEDVQREHPKEVRTQLTIDIGCTCFNFSAVDPKALELATSEELIMYKHKIPQETLLRSKHLPFKIIEFYLDIIAKNEKDGEYDRMGILKGFLADSLYKNKELTMEQQIETIVKIGSRNFRGRRPQRIKSIPTRENTFKIIMDCFSGEELTVQDFHNYYKKVRGKNENISR